MCIRDSRKASRKKEQAETSEECRDNVGTMSAVDKNRTDKSRTDKSREDIDITSACAEASADKSDGLTSRAEKLTGTSQDTAVRAEAETSETKPTERTEGRDAVEPKDLSLIHI